MSRAPAAAPLPASVTVRDERRGRLESAIGAYEVVVRHAVTEVVIDAMGNFQILIARADQRAMRRLPLPPGELAVPRSVPGRRGGSTGSDPASPVYPGASP